MYALPFWAVDVRIGAGSCLTYHLAKLCAGLTLFAFTTYFRRYGRHQGIYSPAQPRLLQKYCMHSSTYSDSCKCPQGCYAAAQLRKRISQKSGELWTNVPQADQDLIKANLPEVVLAVSSKIIHHTGARVITAIASIELPNQQQPELLSLIIQCCTSVQV